MRDGIKPDILIKVLGDDKYLMMQLQQKVLPLFDDLNILKVFLFAQGLRCKGEHHIHRFSEIDITIGFIEHLFDIELTLGCVVIPCGVEDSDQ